MWCCGACIFLSCVDWRRKLSTSCTSSTSISTKTASPPHTMAVMPPGPAREENEGGGAEGDGGENEGGGTEADGGGGRIATPQALEHESESAAVTDTPGGLTDEGRLDRSGCCPGPRC